MELSHLTDKEIGLHLAKQLRAWRVDPNGAGMTLDTLSRRSGMGLTPLRRFEKTGGITLRNLIALMRAMGLLDRLADLIPAVEAESPMQMLERERRSRPRQRAPRASKRNGLPPDPLGYDTSDLMKCALEMSEAALAGRNREAVREEIERVERRLGKPPSP